MLGVLTWLSSIGAALTWVLATYMALISLYMTLNLLGTWLGRSRPQNVNTFTSFVVIVPAHNEEQGIASTVRQIQGALHARERLSIVVIADNCTDHTADRAREAGAHVLERNDLTNRGKGQALGWALSGHHHLFSGAELIAFIDADMNVDPGFFAAMAGAFADGTVQVAQGRYVIANPSKGVLSAVGFASYCYVNHVRPAGRCFWGGTADLKGSGMVFRSGFLLPRGWNAHSITEDVQLGKELMLEGVRIHFVPDAIVNSEIPATLSQIRVQQSRWEGGKHQIVASAFPRTVAKLLRAPSVLLLDGILDMLVPQLSVVIALDLVGLASGWWLAREATLIFLGSLSVFALAVLTGLVKNRASPGVYLRLAAAPMFVVWKLGLLARLAIQPAEKSWKRTPRDSG